MNQIKQFKNFGIQAESQSFTGDKIKVERILNREIIVHAHKIGLSKFTDKGNGKRLDLQISIGETKHIVFTGSANLMDMISKVPADGFPFQTTIIKVDDRYVFS